MSEKLFALLACLCAAVPLTAARAEPVAHAAASVQALPALSVAAGPKDPAKEPGASKDAARGLGDRATEIVMRAMGALDTPYRLGGTSALTGFDCSGFVRVMVQQAAGMMLPRTAAQQAAATQHIEKTELRPGDLVFFNTLRRAFSHVGIYVGDGKFIHAPRTGAQVRVESMNSRYWQTRFNGARRVLHSRDGGTLHAAAPHSMASLLGFGAAPEAATLAQADVPVTAAKAATAAAQTDAAPMPSPAAASQQPGADEAATAPITTAKAGGRGARKAKAGGKKAGKVLKLAKSSAKASKGQRHAKAAGKAVAKTAASQPAKGGKGKVTAKAKPGKADKKVAAKPGRKPRA